METVDMSEVFHRMDRLDEGAAEVKAKGEVLRDYTNWSGVPKQAFDRLVRLGVVVDQLIDEFDLDAYAIRCWLEIQEQMGISPCVILSETNERGKIGACEVDVGSAVTMYALHLASGEVSTCLDWNNNFEEEDDKCILFHCGPVPQSMMTAKGQIVEHAILATAVGGGCSYGCNTGRIVTTPFTFGNLLTEDGKLKFYLGQGRFTEDNIPDDFFGCAGVAEIDSLQSVLQNIGYAGHRHHVSVTPGHVAAPVHEAFARYLGYEVMMV
jgi:L-fucose isomerase-like protein